MNSKCRRVNFERRRKHKACTFDSTRRIIILSLYNKIVISIDFFFLSHLIKRPQAREWKGLNDEINLKKKIIGYYFFFKKYEFYVTKIRGVKNKFPLLF